VALLLNGITLTNMNPLQYLYPLSYIVISSDAVSVRDVRSGVELTKQTSVVAIDHLSLESIELKPLINALLKNLYPRRFIASKPVVVIHPKFDNEIGLLSEKQKKILVDVVLKSGASVAYIAGGDVAPTDQELLDLGLDRRKHLDIYGVLAVMTAFFVYLLFSRGMR
jgi:hypothetical protein